MDWYCSGIGSIEHGYGFAGNRPEQGAYVAESEVTDEIRQDLFAIGWTVEPYPDN
jgi:hypothetical protein